MNYVVKFQKYVNQMKWNDEAFIIIFRRNLKDNIKNKIMCDEKNYENFQKLIEIVINFDDKLYKRIMKKCYNALNRNASI